MRNIDKSLYENVRDDLHRRIREGEFCPGARMHSIKELSGHYGVSEITAGRAVRELQRLGVVRTIRRRGTFVRERHAEATSAPGPTTRRRVALVYDAPALPNEFFYGQVWQGFASAPEFEGFEVDPVCLPRHDITGMGIDAGRRDCDAITVLGGGARAYANAMSIGDAVPMVAVDCQFPKCDCILSDNYGGMCALVTHMADLGHRRLLLASGFLTTGNVTNENERREAFRLFTQHAGLQGQIVSAGQYEDVFAALRSSEPPTAVLFTLDAPAIRFHRIATSVGFRIPEQFSLSGFDDYAIGEPFLDHLTTVRADREGLGRVAARRLHEALSVHESIHAWVRVPCALKARDTTGPRRS